MALGRLLRLDIAAADLIDGGRHRHILIHHLDAVLGGFLRQRNDRRFAGVAHHGDAVGMRRHRLAQLLGHFFVGPAREHIVDLGARIGGGLPRAIIDDGAERVALGPANEEAQVNLAAPLVAQCVGLGGRPDQQRDESALRQQRQA
jgi:hypothetical protein